jgi:hypothetical protein
MVASVTFTVAFPGENSRRLAEEVRDRVENTDDEGKQDDEVFPNGITIHLDYPKPGLISRA